jgi:hypothetical protein
MPHGGGRYFTGRPSRSRFCTQRLRYYLPRRAFEGIKWKARPDISTTWSATRETREQAVESCVEDAIKLFADFEAATLRDDTETERRRKHLAELNEQLRQTICAHDANLHQTDKPAINSIVLNGLSENEIRRFFGVVVESFKREDSELPR